MKFVINKCYGGFSTPDCFRSKAYEGYDEDRGFEKVRINPEFIAWVENNPDKTKFGYSQLKVVEIPDDATDWELSEYDGCESITAIVYGRIFHIS